MVLKRTYILLAFSIVLVFYACGRDRRSRRRHSLLSEAEIASDNQGRNYSNSGIWSQEDFDLLAPAMPGYIPSQILERLGYITSYNNKTLCPNWVAWPLSRDHTEGPYTRKGVPYYDDHGNVLGIGSVTPDIESNGYFVDLECEEPRQLLTYWSRDYNMSHGHICPAGDNKWDKAAMNQSFFLSNMCPQDASLNSGAWRILEEKCRDWAKKYATIYIVAGPIYSDSLSRYLEQIAIPDAFFKVVLCLLGEPKAIGFIYENSSKNQSMNTAYCSIDYVEERTGFDFFPELSDDIEAEVESNSNIDEWK